MKRANADGRAVLVLGDEIADIAIVSNGRFGPDPMTLYRDWEAFVRFAATITAGTGPLDAAQLGNPVPRPAQVFAIGINYRSHADEAGLAIPDVPAVFTKFPASLAGPYDPVEVAGHAIDWEAELVAVIGRRADRVNRADAWSHVAGLAIGQDISDRHLQLAAASVLPLLPGDIIFTGTPAGIGAVRQPPRFLQPGDVLETWVEQIGITRNLFIGPDGEKR